jgi:hypothetical protein
MLMVIAAATAPAWVTYTALAIACVGAATGLASLVLAIMNYMSLGHKVTVSSSSGFFECDESKRVISIGATVINSRRGAVDVTSFFIQPEQYGSSAPIFDSDIGAGPTLPTRLSGGSTQKWVVNIYGATQRLTYDRLLQGITYQSRDGADGNIVRLGVTLGDGSSVVAKTSSIGLATESTDTSEND